MLTQMYIGDIQYYSHNKIGSTRFHLGIYTYRMLFEENNFRLTVSRDENKTSTKVVLVYSPVYAYL